IILPPLNIRKVEAFRILNVHIMDPLQSQESGEGSSVSLENNRQAQLSFKNSLIDTEASPISPPYDPDIIEMFNEDSFDEENEELALKIYKGQTFQTWDDVEDFLKKIWTGTRTNKIVNQNVPDVNGELTGICLSEDMLEFIDFCVAHSTTRARNIEQLLKDKFLDRKIYKKNLYNAIQRAKKKLPSSNDLDATNLMQHLYHLKTNDPRWFVEARFDVKSFNRKIYDSVKANSSLMTLVKEIQDLLNRESEYTCVEEYKSQVPMKVIDVAINTNSYDKFIELCHQFLTNKELMLNKDNQSKNIPITNLVISTRKGRPPGRAKSAIEIQESNARKRRCLSNTDTNIQSSDNRKQCQKCEQKGHNRATCKAEINDN
ncbi:18497_t:CDS:2, partial [Racocetra fulgida]